MNPSGPADGPYRVLRGGGWSTFSTNMRTANRFHDLVLGSPSGVRCARSTAPGVVDAVEPMRLVALSGDVRAESGSLTGRALYVTAFDADDVDAATGLLAPGRSPVAEVRLRPEGESTKSFVLEVPMGSRYLVSAALDAGAAEGDGFVAPSGTGGMGQADQNPVDASDAVSGLTIVLRAPPRGDPQGAAGPQGPGTRPDKTPSRTGNTRGTAP